MDPTLRIRYHDYYDTWYQRYRDSFPDYDVWLRWIHDRNMARVTRPSLPEQYGPVTTPKRRLLDPASGVHYARPRPVSPLSALRHPNMHLHDPETIVYRDADGYDVYVDRQHAPAHLELDFDPFFEQEEHEYVPDPDLQDDPEYRSTPKKAAISFVPRYERQYQYLAHVAQAAAKKHVINRFARLHKILSMRKHQRQMLQKKLPAPLAPNQRARIILKKHRLKSRLS